MPNPLQKPRRLIAKLLLALALSAILLFSAFYALLNWHGHRSWQKYLARQNPRDQLLLEQYLQSKIPDHQNFAKTPALLHAYSDAPAPVHLGPPPARLEAIGNHHQGTWTQLHGAEPAHQPVPLSQQRAAATKILESHESLQSFFAQLHAAADRPYSRFDSSLVHDGPVPNFPFLRSIAHHLLLRSFAYLALNNPDAAARELKVLSQLSQGLAHSPAVMLATIRFALLGAQTQPFYEGWARRQWSQKHYSDFQGRLARIDLLNEFDLALRLGEKMKTRNLVQRPDRATVQPLWSASGHGPINTLYTVASHVGPSGWWKQNLVLHHQLIDFLITNSYNLIDRRLYPQRIEQSPATVRPMIIENWPVAFLASKAPFTLTRTFQALARTQSTLNQIIIVCALERYFSQYHRYPENLDSLLPEFCDSLPKDLISGQPPIYRLNPDGSFTLYSLGWNGRDDHGQTSGDWQKDFYEADLVWPFAHLPLD